MAAGSGAASGHGARSSTAALEASLDRRFQGVSNTMESIQGLSAWCIENKKYHSLVVRYWMKWLKKSDTNHRLNLFYLANDVIQNCKRKNAIAFRSTFAEVLPNAAQLVKDGKVRKSVERIFSIWEERSVYPEELIAQFKAGLNKKDREREREKERQKEKEKEKGKESPPIPAQANPKAALKSKIVAEFTPQSFIEQLTGYKRAVEEEEFREKQLAALRVDVCSTEALKRLKDKAGGNKFAKDFEDGSLKLQEFVSFLEKELKTGPPLLEALGNADIFYEMQYKEVKIVANAYNAFANRVASLKRKLDALKSSLPGPEDSPIPSPSEDAPSPTGSDSPFLGLGASRAQLDPELDGKAMDEGEVAKDNRDPEDMDMSDEEADNASISDEKKEKASTVVSKTTKLGALSKLTLPTTPTKSSKANATTPATATPVTPTSTAGLSAPTTPLGVNLANVDLGKISSILSSITTAMKNTASPSSRPSPGTPTTPSGQPVASKVAPPSPALASILSRVDITPEGILNALSKTNTPGLSSLLQSVTNSSTAPPTRTSPESSAPKAPLTPTTPKSKPIMGNSLKRETPGRTRDWEKERQLSPPPPPPPRPSVPSVSPPSLESKINSFLQGNPGFSLGLGDVSPLGGDGVDGTPVRDEAAATPTQDEIMDTPGSMPESLGSSGGHNLSPTAYRSDPWDAVITPTGSSNDGDFLASSSRYGTGKKSAAKLKDEEAMNMRKQGVASSPLTDMMKGKKDGQSSQMKVMGNSRALAERRASLGSRKASTGSEEGSLSGKREDKLKGREGGSPGGEGEEVQYHRIETLVSPCTEGAPIQTLGYSNRPQAGERIQTVESIRVIGRGSRRGGGAGSRPGGAVWYEEEEYMEAQPPSPHAVPPPLNISQGGSEDMTPSMPPPPHPPPHLVVQHLHPRPPPPSPSHTHAHPTPQAQFQMPYHAENMQTPPPSHLHQHPPPPSPFFTAPPPIPRPPPPPILQRPIPPPNFPSATNAVMVGGVLVPVDRPLPLLPPVRPEGAERGAAGAGPRGGKAAPPPLMSSLLGEPPKLPRPGTVKEPFIPRHAPPLHRPGTPGAPPPLLGRVKEPLNLPPPSPSPTPSSSSSPSTPSSPAVDSAPPRLPTPAQSPAPSLQKPPASPPAQPRNQTPNPSSSPVPLLHLPSPRPPILSVPIPQRPLLRGRAPTPHLNQDHTLGGFRGGKRPGPPFTGGPFHATKRPFLPPRY
ncbi:regulation of nuclear pre-mRNA domain-containing protein 2-like isoform X2 [Myripristis murdjan]|uniref:regulation of nuclear pre-mRNA domain-containing protein 2-like isoform X2 n=1 Tax=Myripristis murdjan TaxID=586833 RepID=UPI001175E415|nr:regulation of nuclear pre-mRNA domain-containing protein 2-like isoform X2 [Myripristis murdjan]